MGYIQCSIYSALGTFQGTRPPLHVGKRCASPLYPQKISTVVPGGAIGDQLKSKSRFRKASSNRQGFKFSGESRLRVSNACRIRQHHKCNGNLGLHIDNPAVKRCLNIWITLSEMMSRFRPCGTSWCWAPSQQMNFFIRAKHSLSRMCGCGWRPWSMMCLQWAMNAQRSSEYARDSKGSARIEFILQSWSTMMHLQPHMDVTEKIPVCRKKIYCLSQQF